MAAARCGGLPLLAVVACVLAARASVVAPDPGEAAAGSLQVGPGEETTSAEAVGNGSGSSNAPEQADNSHVSVVALGPGETLDASGQIHVDPNHAPPVRMDTILKTFFINLSDDKKRLGHILNELKSLGMAYEPVPAVAPVQIRAQPDFESLVPKGCFVELPDPSSPPLSTDPELSKKQRSCCSDFSHRRAYARVAAQQTDGLYLVVEDDVSFEEGWIDDFRDGLKTVPDDWSMLRIGYFAMSQGWKDPSELAQDRVNGTRWMRSDRNGERRYYGAQAVVLTPAKAAALLKRAAGGRASFADSWTGGNNSYVLDRSLVGQSKELGSARETGKTSNQQIAAVGKQ